MRLRLAGGRLRGRRLHRAPGSRPTQERVREALFSRWGAGLAGARLLELFAGSGAVGLEALSRGAAWCGFVEGDRRALATLERNRRELELEAHSDVLLARLPGALARLPASWPPRVDLIYADPPYDFAAYGELVAAAVPLLEAGGELVVEHSVRLELELPATAVVIDERRYGDSVLTMIAG